MWRKVWFVVLALVLVAGLLGVADEVHKGALVDEVVFTSEPDNNKGVAMVEAGEADLYAYSIANPDLFKKVVASPNVDYYNSYGVYTELTLNPCGPELKDGRLNPFYDPKIREAMNWLIDRDYIASEIYGGLAIPRYFAITPTFPDYAKVVDVARTLETKYAHNPDKAKQVITEEMKKLGAELVDGKWMYKGQPVKLIALIRVEDERKEIGDYVSNLLEDLGFTVERQYKTSGEASPCWIRSDPAGGCFNFYTGGWVTTSINRDQGGNFDFFYTPRGLPFPLWQAYKPAKDFDEVAAKLGRGDYKTVAEREKLMAEALTLSMQDSVRVWVSNESPFFARRPTLEVASDLAGGPYGSWLWAYTIHRTDQKGGTIKVAIGQMMKEPWNPVAGTNWIYDMMPIRGTSDPATLPDPYTGLRRPQRVEKAEVEVVEGLPVTKTLDWVDLKFVPEIQVPKDAWIDWDAEKQEFVTVGDKYPDGLTAKTKTVVYYDKNLFNTKWHDGSNFSIGDILLPLIMTFDEPNEKSAIYDEAQVPGFEQFIQYFKGFRIVQENPLVIEWYSDYIYPDAEYIAADAALDAYWGYGPGSWDAVAVGILAEANKELAFSADKADKLGVEWMNYIAGPSLKILAKYLDQAIADKYIPYANTLGKYVTADEAATRYANLKNWYDTKGHFWVGNGPFYLDSVDTVAGIVDLKRFADFPDPSDKWAIFASPKLAKVKVAAPQVLQIGSGAMIPVDITFKGTPYPQDEIDFVKYLIFDANGDLKLKGQAEYMGGATWEITLTPEDTKKLIEGSTKLEVVVSSKVISIPTFADVTFITTP